MNESESAGLVLVGPTEEEEIQKGIYVFKKSKTVILIYGESRFEADVRLNLIIKSDAQPFELINVMPLDTFAIIYETEE